MGVACTVSGRVSHAPIGIDGNLGNRRYRQTTEGSLLSAHETDLYRPFTNIKCPYDTDLEVPMTLYQYKVPMIDLYEVPMKQTFIKCL